MSDENKTQKRKMDENCKNVISSVVFDNTLNFGVDFTSFSKFVICFAKSSFCGLFFNSFFKSLRLFLTNKFDINSLIIK